MDSPPPIIGAQIPPAQTPAPAVATASRSTAIWALGLICVWFLGVFVLYGTSLWIQFKIDDPLSVDIGNLFEKHRMARNIITPINILISSAGAFLLIYSDRRQMTGWVFNTLVGFIILNGILSVTHYLGYQLFFSEIRDKLEELHGVFFVILFAIDIAVGVGIYSLLSLGRTRGIRFILAGVILIYGLYGLFLLLYFSTAPNWPLPPDWAKTMSSFLGFMTPLFEWWSEHGKISRTIGFLVFGVLPWIGLLSLGVPMAMGRSTRPNGGGAKNPGLPPVVPVTASPEYFVHHQGELQGPFRVEQLQGELQAGRILPTDLASKQGDATWSSVQEVLQSERT